MTDWPLKMGPEEYLKRHPEGKNAELASAILAERTDEEYETSMWAGKVMYHCPLCPYSTVDREAVDKHVRGGRHTGARWSKLE